MTHKLDFSLVFLNICFIKKSCENAGAWKFEGFFRFFKPHYGHGYGTLSNILCCYAYLKWALLSKNNGFKSFMKLHLLSQSRSWMSTFGENLMNSQQWKKIWYDFIKVLATNIKTNRQKRDFCSTKFYLPITAMVYIFEN